MALEGLARHIPPWELEEASLELNMYVMPELLQAGPGAGAPGWQATLRCRWLEKFSVRPLFAHLAGQASELPGDLQ